MPAMCGRRAIGGERGAALEVDQHQRQPLRRVGRSASAEHQGAQQSRTCPTRWRRRIRPCGPMPPWADSLRSSSTAWPSPPTPIGTRSSSRWRAGRHVAGRSSSAGSATPRISGSPTVSASPSSAAVARRCSRSGASARATAGPAHRRRGRAVNVRAAQTVTRPVVAISIRRVDVLGLLPARVEQRDHVDAEVGQRHRASGGDRCCRPAVPHRRRPRRGADRRPAAAGRCRRSSRASRSAASSSAIAATLEVDAARPDVAVEGARAARAAATSPSPSRAAVSSERTTRDVDVVGAVQRDAAAARLVASSRRFAGAPMTLACPSRRGGRAGSAGRGGSRTCSAAAPGPSGGTRGRSRCGRPVSASRVEPGGQRHVTGADRRSVEEVVMGRFDAPTAASGSLADV